jgi:hypothetical protein
VKSELFHDTTTRGLTPRDISELQIAAGLADPDGEALCQWRRQNPREALDVLFRSRDGLPMIIKLFPDHLSTEQLSSAIFSRDDIGFLMLRRRPIECFISNQKARSAGKFSAIDTTAIKPELSVKPFLRWSRKVRKWYDWLDEQIESRNLPCVRLSFERDFAESTNAEALSLLLQSLETLGLDPVAMPRRVKAAERQDREPDYRNRVANWGEFESELNARTKTARFLKWAEAVW